MLLVGHVEVGVGVPVDDGERRCVMVGVPFCGLD